MIVVADEDLRWLFAEMGKTFEIKSQILGPARGQVKEARVLNRVVRWTDTVIEYEADQRHSDLIIEHLKLEGARPVATLTGQGIGNRGKTFREESFEWGHLW